MFSQEILDKVAALWKLPSFSKLYKEIRDLYSTTEDGFIYLMPSAQEICAPMHAPSFKHVLYSRLKTTGVEEVKIEQDSTILTCVDGM